MEVENFYGCYLLYSLNEKYKGRTYIGFTVDPNRRIQQHNKGLKAGGAWKTNDKGPWDMVLIVHGFPNDVSALRFEWAWQHPQASRRLRHVNKKQPRENALKFCFRVLSEMLKVGPWNRLPLTVQWLDINYKQEFDVSKLPPLHIPICYGPIQPRKFKKSEAKEDESDADISLKFCYLCDKIITKDDKNFACFNTNCSETFHILCLGRHFQEKDQKEGKFLIPVEGACPKCSIPTLWGDVFLYTLGCYRKFSCSTSSG
ncbi:structure-specific endonuclease subunit slx1 [Trichonephila inaurata madagascariensis]|uniref:Structure-specific endonuclease subunit SLX1 homolog n=1 Tax=Trichonephila inaurata madagascariensis TaxID=2747483 RepID=A0A8X6WQ98_9ARAC|nr:structure-specific endonuclease subunit slx1 [Trichonephila inaurata madagascariensis]